MKRSNYLNLGAFFLIAGIGMIVAENSQQASLDLPDVYAASSLSGTTAISTVCSPAGNSFFAPANIAVNLLVTAGTASSGITNGAATVVTGTGVGANGVSAETSSLVIFTSLLNTSEVGNTATYRIGFNGPRLRRDVQCLNMSLPYTQLALNLSAAVAATNALAVSNLFNASSGQTWRDLTQGAINYAKGLNAVNDAVNVDPDIAELLYGGVTNMTTGMGYSLRLERDISAKSHWTETGLSAGVQFTSEISPGDM